MTDIAEIAAAAADTAAPPPPLCFVLMPFGRKTDAAGRVTNFDSVYRDIIAPAVEDAGLEPIRADEEKIGGTIHKPMFERLMLCHYAVADITGANPNVFYELGIRHALRPFSTAILFLEGTVIPFDIALVRGISYKTDGAGEPVDPAVPRAAIAKHMAASRNAPHEDSPIYQLLDDLPRWEIDHTKTDTFRKEVDYSKKYKKRLADAVADGAAAVRQIAAEAALQNLNEIEAGIIVDLYLSLRDVEGHDGMVELYNRMPEPLQRAKLIREQLGFALNRLSLKSLPEDEQNPKEAATRKQKLFEQAEKVLTEVIGEFGASSETNGLLGRIYKDRWKTAAAAKLPEARSLLRRAIDTYLQGFEADWRDAYPGVNALTLMEQQDKPDPRKARILPVVCYSVSRKIEKNPDYWDYATLLELAVLGNDRDAADDNLAETASHARHAWEVKSTRDNLALIRRTREARNEEADWIKTIEDQLQRKADELEPAK